MPKTTSSISTLEVRLRQLMAEKTHGANDWKFLERETGIDAEKWRNFNRSVIKAFPEMIEALAKALPHRAYWLVTGEHLAAQSQKGIERLHYYAFSFVHGQATASVYIGYPDQKVSIPRLQAAKLEANMPKDAVLVGLGYMGFMTDEECDGLV